MSLADRQIQYEKNYDHTIIGRVPLIIRVDGDGFSKLTRNLERPYNKEFMLVMANTMLKSIGRINGSVFGYQQSDEITFVIRNDQSLDYNPWLGNRIQKIASKCSAIVTQVFNQELLKQDPKLDLVGPACFDCRVFAVPDITEAINNLIYRQSSCINNALSSAVLNAVSEIHGKKTAARMIEGLSKSDRKELLLSYGEIFEENYPPSFINGICCYKIPKIITTDTITKSKYTWSLDFNTKNFIESRRKLELIIENFGEDIFRSERDL